MKKIFAGIVLPTLAAAAVIGSGFSIWFFGENQDKVSTTASIGVENLLRIGEMGKNSTATLRLDQTKAVREKILTSDLVNETTQNGNFDKASNYSETDFGKGTDANGLYLVGTGTPAFDGTITYTAPTDGHVDSLDDSYVEIKTTFKFEGKIANYVGMDAYDETGTLKNGWDVTNATTGVYVYTWQTETTNTLPMLTAGTVSASTFKFAYVAYNAQYNALGTGKVDPNRAGATTGDYAARGVMATAEPHTDAEYSDMLAKINDGTGSKLTIETVATIVANA